DSHDGHASDQAVDGGVVAAGADRGGQQLIEADEHHDAGDGGKGQAHGLRAEERHEQDEAHGRAGGFGQAGEGGPFQGLPTGAGGLADGDSHGDALRDVVDGNRDGDRDGDLGVGQAGDEGGETLGEVVDGDRDRGEYSGPHHPAAAFITTHRAAHGGRFVGVDGGGYQAVDDGDEGDADEEGPDGRPVAAPFTPDAGEFLDGLEQNLHEGDEEHHAHREAEGPGKEPLPRCFAGDGD